VIAEVEEPAVEVIDSEMHKLTGEVTRELVVAIGGEKLLERKAKTFAPPRRSLKTTPEPSH
jgi:hypothetical protein